MVLLCRSRNNDSSLESEFYSPLPKDETGKTMAKGEAELYSSNVPALLFLATLHAYLLFAVVYQLFVGKLCNFYGSIRVFWQIRERRMQMF